MPVGVAADSVLQDLISSSSEEGTEQKWLKLLAFTAGRGMRPFPEMVTMGDR